MASAYLHIATWKQCPMVTNSKCVDTWYTSIYCIEFTYLVHTGIYCYVPVWNVHTGTYQYIPCCTNTAVFMQGVRIPDECVTLYNRHNSNNLCISLHIHKSGVWIQIQGLIAGMYSCTAWAASNPQPEPPIHSLSLQSACHDSKSGSPASRDMVPGHGYSWFSSWGHG